MTQSNKSVGQVGYQVFLQQDTKNIRLHMEAINRVCTKFDMSEIYNVLHPFGGLGMAAQCMDRTLKRSLIHAFWERDPNCAKYLAENYGNVGNVLQVNDSFKSLLEHDLRPYGFVFLDPTAMTVKKEGLWDCWRHLARSEVKYVWFVDSAISKIWLHLKTYSDFFGGEVTSIREYFYQYHLRLSSLGYGIVDLSREGTVVYGLAQFGAKNPTPEIEDLR